MAAYQDGLYVYDIIDPANPVQVGYFDTHPQNLPGTYPSPAYAGCWAAYTELPSGNILASDMQLGLFVLDVTGLPLSVKDQNMNAGFEVYPSPAVNTVNVKIAKPTGEQVVTLTDANGKQIYTGSVEKNNEIRIPLENASAGIYTITLKSNNSSASKNINVIK
jgi:hypothetical protein